MSMIPEAVLHEFSGEGIRRKEAVFGQNSPEIAGNFETGIR